MHRELHVAVEYVEEGYQLAEALPGISWIQQPGRAEGRRC
jgi:hypothetical protein